MNLKRFLELYKYILKFHPVKYFGILIMMIVPLFVIYRFIFLDSHFYELFAGIFGSLIIGSFIWSLGWDPYA